MGKKKKLAVFIFPKYPSKSKFKKFFIFKSSFKSIRFVEAFSYSQSSFNLSSKLNWKKMSGSAFFSSKVIRFFQPYRKVIFRSTQHGFINENTLKGLRRLLAPYFRGKRLKKISALSITSFTNYTFTRKPSAVRIGGGVGKKPRLSGFNIRPGQPILAIYTRQPYPIFKRLQSLKKKFPVKLTSVIF